MTALLRLLLAVAYPLIAHAASVRQEGVLAALAVFDVIVIVLLEPLARRRGWAWALLLLLGVGAAMLVQSRHALLPLLLVPVLFVGLVAFLFGRTLAPGRVPLISKIVAALEQKPAQALAPELQRYTRQLTLAWTLLLAALALVDGLLALVAVPGGLLDSLGIVPPITVSRVQWSWFANLLDYGIVGGFFVAEYLYRKRRFPGRYRNFADFMRKMAALGPEFWRTLLH
ncbi:MAG TPA: ketosynthase [Luteimonas sp.]|nr:ketosynthase [Luteimonas sp.]